MAVRILTVDDSEVVTKLIDYQLSELGYEILIAHDGPTGFKMAKEEKPDVIILDVQMPGMDGYEVCEKIRNTPSIAKTPVIILSAMSSLANLQSGFRAGADDYVPKPFKAMELQLRVEAQLRRKRQMDAAGTDADQPTTGYTISVFSLRGGAGTSSLAANLAVGLSQLWGTQAALVDLALPTGLSDIMLNLKPKHGMMTLVRRDINDLDEVLVAGHLTEHPSGAHLLAGIVDPMEAELVSDNLVGLILNHLKNVSPYIVIDTAHNFSAPILAALDASDRILMPITPDINSARLAASALKVFDSLGYDRDNIDVVLNWTFAKAGLATERIERFIDHPVKMVIPYSPDAWSEAINLGQPVITKDAGTPLASLLEDMVWRFSTETDRKSKQTDRTEMWKRIAKRRWKRRADSYVHEKD